MAEIKVFTAFSGYDSQCMALDRLGVDYELVGWSEIDKYAIEAHNAVYPQYSGRNYGDICKIDWTAVPDFDLFTYSFPCQDISIAGEQKGFTKGSGTRSSLLWECERAIKLKLPKYLIMENVKALTFKKNIPGLRLWQSYLSNLGYTNYTQILNAKDYGVPQNRERVFMVSILNAAGAYFFPEHFTLTKRLKDILEKDVDPKYFLSEKIIAGFKKTSDCPKHGHCFKPKSENDIAFTIRTAPGSRVDDNYIKILCAGNVHPSGAGMNGVVLNTEGICTTLTTAGEGPKICSPIMIQKAHGFNKGGAKNLAPAITTSGWQRNNFLTDKETIRKLTPRECFRLMGVEENNISKLEKSGLSRTQLYKLAGNSIVVDVLYYVFKNLLSDEYFYIDDADL